MLSNFIGFTLVLGLTHHFPLEDEPSKVVRSLISYGPDFISEGYFL